MLTYFIFLAFKNKMNKGYNWFGKNGYNDDDDDDDRWIKNSRERLEINYRVSHQDWLSNC